MAKEAVSFEIEGDQKEWLEKMVSAYDIADASKALRILLDYAIEDADEGEVFAPQNGRCRHCG